MNVAILGTEQPSQLVAQIIEKNYNSWLERQGVEKLNIVAYVAKDTLEKPIFGNLAVLNMLQFFLLYKKKLIDKIIFPRESYFETQKNFLTQFQAFDIKIEDIIIATRLNDSINVYNFLEPYLSAKYLVYLEFHIADHCNLNCKACSHYSGLVKEPKFPNFEKFAQDFSQLKKFIEDIGVIRILGGEPLLNPEINKYVELTRKLYPHAKIFIVTNAILLPKMLDDFFKTLKENDAAIWISCYPPIQNKMAQIHSLLREKQVQFVMGPLMKEFVVKQTLKRNNNAQIFYCCYSATCNFLYEGKLSVCPENATTKYFNEYYNQNLPTDGALDLYEENLTTEKLKKFLLTPFERCSYCTENFYIKWEAIKYPSPLSDWVLV